MRTARLTTVDTPTIDVYGLGLHCFRFPELHALASRRRHLACTPMSALQGRECLGRQRNSVARQEKPESRTKELPELLQIAFLKNLKRNRRIADTDLAQTRKRHINMKFLVRFNHCPWDDPGLSQRQTQFFVPGTNLLILQWKRSCSRKQAQFLPWTNRGRRAAEKVSVRKSFCPFVARYWISGKLVLVTDANSHVPNGNKRVHWNCNSSSPEKILRSQMQIWS